MRWLTLLCIVFPLYGCSPQLEPVNKGERPAVGKTYFVKPGGSDHEGNGLVVKPLGTIQRALELAMPNDSIILMPGEYLQDVKSIRSGDPDGPIRIMGMPGAVVKGAGKSRIFDISHSYIELRNFTIDGLVGEGSDAKHFRDKLIYLKGLEGAGIEGVRVIGMDLKNAAGECLRIKFMARNNEVAHSKIQNCGVRDFVFERGKHNGEAIYIGTAPEQIAEGRNPTHEVDRSEYNWIHHNVIMPNGSECVDIKEGSEFNLIEQNICTNQKDPNVGGISIRGNRNTVRYNKIFSNLGAGIRVGGDTLDDGLNNNIYGNYLDDNQGGALKLMRMPQAVICGNQILTHTGQKKVRTAEKMDISPFLQACPEVLQ